MTQPTATLTLSLARSGGVALGLSLSTGPSMVPGVGSSAGTSTAAGGGAARWAAAGLAGGTSTAAGVGRATGPAVVAAAILARIPIAYWKLDETSGTTAADSSGNGRNGAYTNSPTLGSSFAPFVAPTFDGTNDYVDIYSAGLAAAMTPAVGTMLCFARLATSAGFTFVVGASDGGSRYLNIAQSTIWIGERRVATTRGVTGPAPRVAAWDMLVLTWDAAAATRMRLYANGTEQGVNTGVLNVWNTGLNPITTLTIGAYDPTVGYFPGQIAHVALFSTVLSAADIAAIYAASGL